MAFANTYIGCFAVVGFTIRKERHPDCAECLSFDG
jgi:hypothetical protein